MQTVKQKITIYVQGIINKLNNSKVVSIDKKQHTQDILYHQQDIVELIENIFMRLQSAISYR